MIHATSRKSTNLTMDTDLVETARLLKINLSRAAENGIRNAVQQEQRQQWLRENSAALDSSNEFVQKQGLPLEKYRNF